MRIGKMGSRCAFVVAAIALPAVIAIGCGGSEDSPADASSSGSSSGGGDPVTLVSPAPETMALSNISIALETSFPELGLDVSLVGTNGNSFVIQQLASGGEDYGIAGAPELMAAASKGQELTSVASLDKNVFTVVAATDSDIDSIEDLDGGVLGITNRGGGEVPLAEAVLRDAGLTDSVELRAVGEAGPTVATALTNGEIDAFATGFNDVAVLEAGAADLTLEPILPPKFQDLPSNQLIVRSSVLDTEEGADIAVRLAKGLRMAYEFSKANPDEAYAMVCERVPADCRDKAASHALYEASVGTEEVTGDEPWGFHNYDSLEVVRSAVADVAPDAEIDLESLFPNTFIDQINEDPKGD